MKWTVFMFSVSSTVDYHSPLYSLDAITSSIWQNKWTNLHRFIARRVKLNDAAAWRLDIAVHADMWEKREEKSKFLLRTKLIETLG